MSTKGTLKKLQQRFIKRLSQRRNHDRPATLEKIPVPCNSLSSEYSSYCCEWSNTSSIESVELSRADYTLESEKIEERPFNQNKIKNFSVQLSEDNYNRDSKLHQIEVPCNSLSSEYSSYCYEWSDTSSIESAKLSRADHTLESQDQELPHPNFKSILNFSAQLSEDNYSRDSDLDLSLLSSIPGTNCSTQLITSPLNSTRHDDSIHSGIADITCSEFTTHTDHHTNMVKVLSEDTSMTSCTCTDTCLTNEESEHCLEVPSPSPVKEPLGPRPPCEGCEAVQVNHELVAGDVVAMTMTRSRERQIKKCLKRVRNMMRDGHQDRLRTLTVI